MTPALFRLTIFNICGAAGLIAAWRLGYVQQVVEADAVHMAYIIAAVFAVGIVSNFWCTVKATAVRFKGMARRDVVGLQIRTEHLRDIFAALFILGIIGNAVGMIVAFGGGSGDAGEIAQRVLAGIGTSFGSTVAGLTLALWLMGANRILATEIDLMSEGI